MYIYIGSVPNIPQPPPEPLPGPPAASGAAVAVSPVSLPHHPLCANRGVLRARHFCG